jgi:hypothetical protein
LDSRNEGGLVGSGGALRSTEDSIYYTPHSRSESTVEEGGRGRNGIHQWIPGTSEVSGHVVEAVQWRSTLHANPKGLQRWS